MSQKIKLNCFLLQLLQGLSLHTPTQNFQLTSKTNQNQVVERTVDHVDNFSLEMAIPEKFNLWERPNSEQSMLTDVD